jgi:hypothetical protein
MLARGTLTELAARKYVESHGGDALGILRERATMAEERGHRVAAGAWRDLADIAARILAASHSGKSTAVSERSAAWRAAMLAALRGPGRGI